MANNLIEKAVQYDALRKAGNVQRQYTREEIELCGAWVEGQISTDALVHAMGDITKAGVGRHVSNALRLGFVHGDLHFVWNPDQRKGRPAGKPNYSKTPRVGKNE